VVHMRIVPVVAAIALVGGLGCKEAEPEHKPVVAPPTEGLELVKPGADPKTVLRYHLAKGTKTPVTLAIDVDLDAAGQGGPLPSMVMEPEIACEDVLPDGSMKIRTTIVHVTAKDRPGGVIPAAQMSMSALDGVTMTGVLAPNGRLEDMQVDLTGKELPPAVSQQVTTLSRSFEQVSMPLPAEPVGIGAQWRNRKTLEQSGMTMLTITTMNVTAIEGDKVVFTSTSDVSGKDQTIMQGGTSIALKNVGGKGSGYGTIDLARMVLAGEVTGELHSEMNAQGQNAKMKMKIVTRMTPAGAAPLPSKPPGPPPPRDANQGAQSAP
jgi:hypothetical protein